MPEQRSETQFAADIVWLLVVNGIIDRRRYTPHQLAITVGCTIEELDDARHRCQTQGVDSLRPNTEERTRERETRNGDRGSSHSGERRCARCGEWWPLEEFGSSTPGDPRPLDGFRRKMCKACFGEFERGHFIAIRHADALHEVIAYLTTEPPDDSVGMVCPSCDEPIEPGDDIEVRGVPAHVKCGKGKR